MKVTEEQALLEFKRWYHSLKYVKANGGPANGTIAATLVILEQLQKSYDLSFENHIAEGGAQIKGASGRAVTNILEKFGEYRPFAKEGGRTNRGGQGEIKPLFEILLQLKLEELEYEERNTILSKLQHFLVDCIKEFHNRQKIKLAFDPGKSTWQNIHKTFEEAYNAGKGGPFAQHLVGAKLQLRFPNIDVPNEPTFAADKPTGRGGDFTIKDTVFHVTTSPMEGLFRKCQENIREGKKVYVVVPNNKLLIAREFGEEYCLGTISVESLESFASQNLDEISVFSIGSMIYNFAKIFQIYNQRVDMVEIDKSIMVELPENLRSQLES